MANPVSHLTGWLAARGTFRPKWLIFCAIAFLLAYRFGFNYAICRGYGTSKNACVLSSALFAQGDAFWDFLGVAGKVFSYILP
jgi:hypothetical protein